MTTESENIVAKISSNLFYKEFTFDKNDFYPEDGKKELADTVLWLGDLLFIIQVKERNPNEIKSEAEENAWFDNKVLKKAKEQIANSIEYLNKRSEEHTSELQSRGHLVCRLLLEKKKNRTNIKK